MKHCITAQTLDLDFILHFLSTYTCEQRLILVHDLEFEYEYKLVDMVLERPESSMRSCTLAMLIEPIELYVRDFRDLLTMKHLNQISSDISRKLVEILLPLSNQEIAKFQETYELLFENSTEKDIIIVLGKESILSKLLRCFLQGKRYEEPGHSATLAKEIAKRLYEAGEGTPGIDYDTFIKIFTHNYRLYSIFTKINTVDQFKKLSNENLLMKLISIVFKTSLNIHVHQVFTIRKYFDKHSNKIQLIILH